jgi:hypothetical protein
MKFNLDPKFWIKILLKLVDRFGMQYLVWPSQEEQRFTVETQDSRYALQFLNEGEELAEAAPANNNELALARGLGTPGQFVSFAGW